MHAKNSSQKFSRRSVLLGITASLAELSGCGGGGASSIAGLSSGGTGSFTSGVIMGLGSIIVNGIRYNNDSAQLISRDDGATLNSSLSLGMVVSIQGSAVTPATTVNGLPTAVATKISLGSEWIGPIANINTGSSTFTVLGNTVDVLTTTIFSGSATSITDLNGATYAEIYGFVDITTGHLQATHVAASNTQPSFYKTSGVVSSYIANTSFRVGSTSITFSSSTPSTGTWSSGTQVRVQLNTVSSGGSWSATNIQVVTSALSDFNVSDHDESEIHGPITNRISATSFYVNGIPVDASGISNFNAPTTGTTVEVHGTVINGIVVATSITSKTVSQLDTEDFEFVGTITNLIPSSASSGTFVLKNITFSYSGSTTTSGFTFANYSNQSVEMKATHLNGQWQAVSLELHN